MKAIEDDNDPHPRGIGSHDDEPEFDFKELIPPKIPESLSLQYRNPLNWGRSSKDTETTVYDYVDGVMIPRPKEEKKRSWPNIVSTAFEEDEENAGDGYKPLAKRWTLITPQPVPTLF